MDKNNNYYLNNIKSKITKLEHKKNQYEAQIIQQEKILEHNNSISQKLKFTNDILHDQYNSLLRLLEKQGIIFELIFNEYKPHQWENLFIVKTSKGYEIQNKAGNSLMILDKNFSGIIQDIEKRDCYNLIVIRITDRTALIQLRFNHISE